MFQRGIRIGLVLLLVLLQLPLSFAEPVSPVSKTKSAWKYDGVHLAQGEYLFSNFNQHPGCILATGFSSFAVLSIYYPPARIGLLANIDSSTDIDTAMDQILSEFKAVGTPFFKLEANILGGWKIFGSQRIVDRIYWRLFKAGVYDVHEAMITKRSDIGERTICFTLKSGLLRHFATHFYSESAPKVPAWRTKTKKTGLLRRSESIPLFGKTTDPDWLPAEGEAIAGEKIEIIPNYFDL